MNKSRVVDVGIGDISDASVLRGNLGGSGHVIEDLREICGMNYGRTQPVITLTLLSGISRDNSILGRKLVAAHNRRNETPGVIYKKQVRLRLTGVFGRGEGKTCL